MVMGNGYMGHFQHAWWGKVQHPGFGHHVSQIYIPKIFQALTINGFACGLCCHPPPNCCICCCCPNWLLPIPDMLPPNTAPPWFPNPPLGCAPKPPGAPNPEGCCWAPKLLPLDMELAPNPPAEPPNMDVGCPAPNPWLPPNPGWFPPKFIWPLTGGCCGKPPPIFPNCAEASAVIPAPPKLRFCWVDVGGIPIFWPPICCWPPMLPQPDCWFPPNDDCWGAVVKLPKPPVKDWVLLKDCWLPNPELTGWLPPKDCWLPNPELTGWLPLKDCWLPNPELTGWLPLKDCWLPNPELGWLPNTDPVPVVALMLLTWFMLFMGPFSWPNPAGPPPKPWNGLDGCCCCCCGCLGCWKPPDTLPVDVFEKGFGPLDIPNEDEPPEPNPVPVLRPVLLPPLDGPNKLSNSLSAAYLSPAVFWVAVLPDADTSGPNPAFDVGCGCDGAEL